MPLPILDEHISAHAAELVGITESAVSHHLRALRQTHIVTARRDGKEVYYSISDPYIVTLFKQGMEHIWND